jgi:hypothetical protein
MLLLLLLALVLVQVQVVVALLVLVASKVGGVALLVAYTPSHRNRRKQDPKDDSPLYCQPWYNRPPRPPAAAATKAATKTMLAVLVLLAMHRLHCQCYRPRHRRIRCKIQHSGMWGRNIRALPHTQAKSHQVMAVVVLVEQHPMSVVVLAEQHPVYVLLQLRLVAGTVEGTVEVAVRGGARKRDEGSWQASQVGDGDSLLIVQSVNDWQASQVGDGDSLLIVQSSDGWQGSQVGQWLSVQPGWSGCLAA